MNVIWRCEPPLYNHVSNPTLSLRDEKQETGICGLTDDVGLRPPCARSGTHTRLRSLLEGSL